MGARKEAMETLLAEMKKVRGGAYFAKRGYFDWSSFPFSARPRGMSASLAEEDLITGSGQIKGTLVFETGMAIPDGAETPGADDGALEEMKDDIVAVIEAIELARAAGDGGAYPVYFAIFPGTGDVSEWYDPGMKAQGITARIQVEF